MESESSTIEFRLAEESDAEEIYTVQTIAIRNRLIASYGEETAKRLESLQTPHQYIPWINAQEITVAVSPEGDVVGFGRLILDSNSDSECEINKLYVSPSMSGKGVGSELLRHLEETARMNGRESAWLKSSLNAEGFYKKMGYSVVDPNCKYVCCELTLDCTLMNKVLSCKELIMSM